MTDQYAKEKWKEALTGKKNPSQVDQILWSIWRQEEQEEQEDSAQSD